MKEDDMEVIASLIDEVITLCKDVSSTCGKTIKEFLDAFAKRDEIEEIRKKVEKFTKKFGIPGSKFEIDQINDSK
jgi:glycine/serine hydroxymethyltransferase